MTLPEDVVCQVAPEWWGVAGPEEVRPKLAKKGCDVCPAKGDACLSAWALGGFVTAEDIGPMVASGLQGPDLVEAINRLAEPNREELMPCGTTAAYRRHLRRGERVCASCRAAQRVAFHERKAAA